ncbi:hypothetical protein [Quadrisphaera setariae]|uniref:Uncharacterized protein n=1 Tax=Quadrisphaera setariae TaxID=2593304 RepID=A0A5C8ZET8_9ACTN|nr:hypothetical protein [Quadrisphaera setariae]TXR56352.1 hypothetical protein FMM08_09600 [Quadrisphaera setariae]
MPGDAAGASDGEDQLGELDPEGAGELDGEASDGELDDDGGPVTGALDPLPEGVVGPEGGEGLAPGPATPCVVVADGVVADALGELAAVGCSDADPEGDPVDDGEPDPVLSALAVAPGDAADEGLVVASGVLDSPPGASEADGGVVVVAQVDVTACSAGAHSDAVTAGVWSAWATAGTASTPRPDRPMTPRARAPRTTAVTGGLQGRGARAGSSAGSVGADPRREGTAGGTARAQDARSLPVREVRCGTPAITRRGRGASS